MKIEKVNDNQIRCTLTSEDLASRRLKISELAYGSEKTQDLFREMLSRAGDKFGFDAGNVPLMIEAIPTGSDSVVLLITKVNDPEELDTRFSRFAPSIGDEIDDEAFADESEFRKFFGGDTPLSASGPSFSDVMKAALEEGQTSECMLFEFSSMKDVMNFATAAKAYEGDSILYKDSRTNALLLSLIRGDEGAEIFRHTCTLATEYGKYCALADSVDSFLSEHYEILINKKALDKLR